MTIASLLASFVAPENPPLNFSEALALGLLGDEVRTYLVSVMGTPTGAITDLWIPGVNMTYPSSAGTVSVVSNNAADTSAGTGAQTVQIVGWDDNWELATETVTLNGTTPVSTSGSFWRVIRARVLSAGSTGSNVGALTVSLGGNVATYMWPTLGASSSPHFTVPPDHVGYIYDWSVSGSMAQINYGAAYLMARPSGEVFYEVEKSVFVDASSPRAGSGPVGVFEAGTDLTVRAWTVASGWVASTYRIAIMPSGA